MERTFRIFIQHHHGGGYTVTLPGLPSIPEPIGAFDDGPAGGSPMSSSLAAHALLLAEVKEEIGQALTKWLGRCDPEEAAHFENLKAGQMLMQTTVELRPNDRHGRKGRDKVRLPFSLLITPDHGDEDDPDLSRATQFYVTVPRFTAPSLSFFVYREDEIEVTAGREIANYLRDHTLDEMRVYEYARRESLETLTVSFTPLKPSQERGKKKGEADDHDETLQTCATELTARAAENLLLPCYGRETEVVELLQILAGEGSASALLVGPSGVGKTSLAHEVVRRIVRKETPKALAERKVWYTSPSKLISGCSYVGQWEERLRDIVAECARRRHLLFIEDLFGLLEAGRWSKSDANMAEFLRPSIADGTVVVIGETSPERLRIAEARNPGFVALFRRIHVAVPGDDRTLSILSRVSGALERRHRVRIEPGACEAAVGLTRRFQPYLSLPGKAVQFLTRAASDTALAASTVAEGRGATDHDRPLATIGRREAIAAFAAQTGLPEFLLSDHLPMDMDAVQRHFEERLIGQADAVATVVDLIAVLKAGLNDPNKPLATLLFVGPTGVGKTEMAKALAEYLFGSRDRLIRYDMSEYADPISVMRLIGSVASGGDEGELTKKIRLQPLSVVLLDEFEKAHASAFDVCLQLFGEGRLTDAGGRTADFRSTIVLLTSNLGAAARERRRVGLRSGTGSADADDAAHFRTAVEEFFRPEFVNRLDRIVAFRALDREAMRQIARREIALLLEREGIVRRHLTIEVDESLLDLLLESGFHPVYGARPLKRAIEQKVVAPLARYLVGHRIVGDHFVTVRAGDGGAVAITSSALTSTRQAVALGESERRKLTPAEMIDALASERRRVQSWDDSPAAARLHDERRELLARTRRADFDAADYGIWQRIQAIERLTGRARQLTERAEYLEEFAAMSGRDRSVSADRYAGELARALTDLVMDNDFLEMELLFANAPDEDTVLLHIAPIGRTSRVDEQRAWTTALTGLYLGWALRKGYEFALLVPAAAYVKRLKIEGRPVESFVPGWSDVTDAKNPPFAALPAPSSTDAKAGIQAALKRWSELEAPDLMLALRGTHVGGFLAGEDGGHKRLSRAGESSGGASFAAQVTCWKPADFDLRKYGNLGSGAAAMLSAIDAEARAQKPRGKPFAVPDSPEIVRLYQTGSGASFVRDTRTGVETTLATQVLEGTGLDRFLLGWLRREMEG